MFVGEIGIDPKYFLYYMSWDEIICTINGYDNRKKDQLRQTRLISYYSCLTNLKKGTKPEDLFKISGDDQVEEPNSDKTTFEHLKNIVGEI